jgi:molybdopterin-containing oxidoreductase family membrane subunit
MAIGAILILLVAGGVAAWIYQLIQGMDVTGLNQQIVWGFYIAAFFTAAGAGAGLLVLTGFSEFVPLLPRTVRSQALALSLVSFVAAGILIMMDVGSPLQAWRIITSLRLTSFLTWDFWMLALAGVVTLLYLWRARGAAPSTTFPALGIIAIIAAAALVLMESWMLATMVAHPLWNDGLTVFRFALAATAGGLALATFLSPQKNQAVRRWLAAILGLNLFLLLAEVITPLLAATVQEATYVDQLLVGVAAPPFWFHLLAGLTLPLVLLALNTAPRLAGALVLAGILAEKTWMLVAGQAEPWLPLPTGAYFPTWVEFLAVLGVVALTALLYMVVTRSRRSALQA